MIIEDKRNHDEVSLDTIPEGEIFGLGENLYIKTSSTYKDSIRCVRIWWGYMICIDKNTKVNEVNAKVVIE